MANCTALFNLIKMDNYTKNPDLSLFCKKKITPLFISIKLDIDISISYKLVPCVAWKDGIALNETPTQIWNKDICVAKHLKTKIKSKTK